MPNASFIGFTGTPIEKTDANTRAVFGDYSSIYDIQRAVADEAHRRSRLAGFDAPCLHTMYADKPMQGHGLMQAIARVTRVFKDKPGGLIVDYLGLADQLKRALATYTESGGQGNPTYDTKQAIAVMHGFRWDKWTTGTPTERLQLIPAGQEHIRLGERQRRSISQPSGCEERATLGNWPTGSSQP